MQFGQFSRVFIKPNVGCEICNLEYLGALLLLSLCTSISICENGQSEEVLSAMSALVLCLCSCAFAKSVGVGCFALGQSHALDLYWTADERGPVTM